MARLDPVSIENDFKEQGYAHANGVIPAGKLAAIARDISQVFVRRADSLGLTVPRAHDQAAMSAQVTALFDHDPFVYRAAAKLAQHLVVVHQLGVGPEVLSLVRAVGIRHPTISTRPVIHFMADRLKIDGGYHKTPPHQDWRSVQGSLDGVTLWIPIFDVGPADYPLEIVPQSHAKGLLPSSEHAFGHQVQTKSIPEDRFVPVSISRGDALIFSGFLVHRTGTRGGPLVRVALSYRFNNASEPTFIARNYPDRYVYRADMELLDPQFPSADQLATIFRSAAGATDA